MSQNQPRQGNIVPPSKTVLDRKRLTKTEAKYLDWNSNVKIRLSNVTREFEGQEGPGMLNPTPEIKSVFAVQPPLKVLPNSTINSVNWKYYRPVSAPVTFGAQRAAPLLKPDKPGVPGGVAPASKPLLTSTNPSRTTTTVSNPGQGSPGLNNVVSKPETRASTSFALSSCLKKASKVKNLRIATASMSKPNSVSFAPETAFIQRENKPKKPRSPKKNRKPRFAHPCCGHFLPPESEIVQFLGPSGLIDQTNLYTRFTAIWRHPSDRTSKETEEKWMVRQKRFQKLLSDLSEAHRRYNTLLVAQKGRCMMREILPRYIMSLDMALMDGDLMHADQLVQTMMTTIRVLQVTLHEEFFLPTGEPKPMPTMDPDGCGYLADLGPVICALNRISGDRARQDTSFLSIEPVLIKLQLEIFSLVICPIKSLMFRCVIAVIPHTISRACHLLATIKAEKNPAYFIKWVNNSVMHRDYMGMLKEFGMADENGCKAELPPPIAPNTLLEGRIRPLTADSCFKKASRF